LHQQPQVTQRQLSQALHCTPRNVTDLVDALEASGLAARGPHPTDRRATLVRLTSRGEAEAAQMQVGFQLLAGTLFGDVAPTDLTPVFSTRCWRAFARTQRALERVACSTQPG
jgi:DNA-binding MarR family transcriptional regulator